MWTIDSLYNVYFGKNPIKLMRLMIERGAQVSYYDPYVKKIPMTREHPNLANKVSVDWNVKSFSEAYDAILIATDHDNLDYLNLANSCKIVVDTRNACSRAGANMENVVLA